MLKIFNKTTQKFNTLKTAIKNGLLETLSNFVLPKDYVLNTKTQKLVKYSNLNFKIRKGLVLPTDLYTPGKIYNEFTKRFIKDTPVNKSKILKLQQAQPPVIIQPPVIQQPAPIKELTYELTKDNLSSYSTFENNAFVYFHRIIPHNIVKQFPNSRFVLTAKFYDNNNTEYKEIKFDFDNWKKQTIDRMDFTFTIGGTSDGAWIIEIELDENAKRIVLTYDVYKSISNGDVNKEIMFNQVYEIADKDPHKCVYSAMLKYFELKLIKNEKDVRAKQILNRLVKNEPSYNKPYNNKNIKKIAQLCSSSIEIVDLIHGNNQKFNENSMNYYNIRIINTRYNHVDLYIGDFYEPTEVSKDDYEMIKSKAPYYVENLGKLYTNNMIYIKAKTKYSILSNELNKTFDMDNMSMPINDTSYKHITTYDYSTHVFFQEPENDNNLYKEVDIIKAYYNFHTYKEYMGLPTGSFITSSNIDGNFNNELFVSQYNNKLVGFYTIKITKSNTKYDFLGFKQGSVHTLYTHTIIQIINDKIEFDYITMSVSPSFTFQFNKDWLEEEDGVKHYCKYFGNLMIENRDVVINIKPLSLDMNYYSIVKNDNYTIYDGGKGILKLVTPRSNPTTKLHIAYAIHSMCKLQVMKQIMNSNICDIIGVKIDSIVYKKETTIDYDMNIFKCKEANIESMINVVKRNNYNYEDNGLDQGINVEVSKIGLDVTMIDTYKNELFTSIKTKESATIINKLFIECYKPFFQTNEYITNRVCFVGGPGGTGKTYDLLYNNSIHYSYLCYSSFANNLITQKYLECKADNKDIVPSTVFKLVGKYCSMPIDKITRKVKYIIIDEATLISKDIINEIIKMYPYCYIFILGDIDYDGTYYQCSTLQSEHLINPSAIKLVKQHDEILPIQYVKYTKTFRFDETLNNRLVKVRKAMRECKESFNPIYKLKNWFLNEWKDRIFNVDQINMLENDVGISCKNDLGDKSSGLNEYFKTRGVNMHYFIKATNIKKGQMAWAQLAEKPEHSNYIETRFRTIHSYQGLQLTHDNNIIICMDSLFDYNLIYTALSRARRVNQIYIFTEL